MLIAMVSYVHEHTEFLTQHLFRAASFVHLDGSDMFAEDMHLSSDACGRNCPSRCRFCKTTAHPKWSREQHIEKTQHSFAIFDRPSLQKELVHALNTGIMGPELHAFYTAHFAQASVSSMAVERKVGSCAKVVAALAPSAMEGYCSRLGIARSGCVLTSQSGSAGLLRQTTERS